MTDSVQGPERLAALLCETAPSEEGHTWLMSPPRGPCNAHRSQAARLTGRVSLPDAVDAPRAHALDCSAVVFAPGAKGQGWEPACDCGASVPDGLRAAAQAVVDHPVRCGGAYCGDPDCDAIDNLRAALGSAPPSDIRLQEIAARLKAATPGPWEYETGGEQHRVGPQTGTSDPYDGALPLVARPVCELYPRKGLGTLADSEFIAHAPDDIAYLLRALGSAPRGTPEDRA